MLGMEHQHMWICAHTKRSQTGDRLSTVQRSSGGQWLLWQHDPVNNEDSAVYFQNISNQTKNYKRI